MEEVGVLVMSERSGGVVQGDSHRGEPLVALQYWYSLTSAIADQLSSSASNAVFLLILFSEVFLPFK